MIFVLPFLLAPLFYFAFSSIWQFAFFCGGIGIALVLMWLDQTVLYRYYSEPEQPVQLVTRSPLFFVAYIPMTLYVITSSGSPLGMGLVLAIGIILATELFIWRNNPQVLNGRFYAHTGKQLSPAEFSWVFRFLVVFLLVMTISIYV
jgi:hypothetical protein